MGSEVSYLVSFFLFKNNSLVYGCAGSSLLHRLFSLVVPCGGCSLGAVLLGSSGFSSSFSEACRIFLDQGSNPCSLHWQVDSLPLSHQGSFLFELLDTTVFPCSESRHGPGFGQGMRCDGGTPVTYPGAACYGLSSRQATWLSLLVLLGPWSSCFSLPSHSFFFWSHCSPWIIILASLGVSLNFFVDVFVFFLCLQTFSDTWQGLFSSLWCCERS